MEEATLSGGECFPEQSSHTHYDDGMKGDVTICETHTYILKTDYNTHHVRIQTMTKTLLTAVYDYLR